MPPATSRHRPSSSCLVAALRDVYEQAGFALSDELVFGLGSGLFFGYGGILEARFFNAAVQAPALELSLCANTGVRLRQYHVQDPEAAWRRLKLLLDRGAVVAVQLNPRYCSHLVRSVDPRLVPYLPAHWVSVVGHDLGRGLVTFHENRRFDAVTMDIAAFKKARHSGDEAQNPLNTWLELSFPAALVPLPTAVRLAIRQTVYAFRRIEALHVRSGPGFYVGLEGLKRFSRQLKTWSRIMPPAAVRENALRMSCSLTVGGFAKDAYRALFARFLDEAASLVESAALVEAARRYRALARLWQGLAGFLSVVAENPEAPEPWREGSPYASLLDAILRAERAAIEALETAVGEWDGAAAHTVGVLQEART
jgi:hypothetical protein